MSKIVAPREEKTAIGVLMMALAVLFFTGIDTSAKWLHIAGYSALQIIFTRYAVNFILALAIFVPREGLEVFRSNSPGKQALRCLFILGSTALNFLALKHLPITFTTTVMFAGPIVVTLVAIPLLGEVVGIRRILAVCTGFFGVLIVIQPWGTAFQPAMFLSLGALVVASMYFVMTRMLAGVDSTATSQMWPSGLATLVLAPFAIPLFQWPETVTEGVVLICIGLFGGVGHICATYAHRLADASILAPVVYIQLFLAAIVSIVVFGTWPSVWTFGGGLIIIASGIYIWQRERTKKRAA